MKRFAMIFGMFTLLLGAILACGDWGTPVNLGPPVNTPYFEILPAVDPGDTLLFFLYQPADLDSIGMSKKIGGVWQTPKFLGPPFNPNAAEVHTSVLAIPGGIRLYFSSKRSGGLGRADIWYSDLISGQWSPPVNLGSPVNSIFNDNSFRIVNGGARAYFTSTRRDSSLNHDIFVTDWVSGEWTTPVNLGDSINSVYSDQSPTVTDDEQEMYFERTGPGMVESQIFTARKANGVWQGAVRVGPPIHPVPNWYDGEPYLLPPGDRLYYSGPEDTIPPYTNWDIWYVDRLVGVEEKAEVRGQRIEVRLTANPNPFTSFATLPGHEAERFSLYDVSGRKVGTCRGDRVGEGLVPGVYFLRSSDSQDKPLRIVKVR